MPRDIRSRKTPDRPETVALSVKTLVGKETVRFHYEPLNLVGGPAPGDHREHAFYVCEYPGICAEKPLEILLREANITAAYTLDRPTGPDHRQAVSRVVVSPDEGDMDKLIALSKQQKQALAR